MYGPRRELWRLRYELLKEINKKDKELTMTIRDIKNGTKINMHFGDTVIPGILNDSEPAREFISRLPYTLRASRYDYDICGVVDVPLSFSDKHLVPGWKNGDIDYTVRGEYFTILFDNEENSYGEFVNLGVVDCDLAQVSALSGSYDVLIELAS